MRFRSIVPILVSAGVLLFASCSAVESPAGAARPRHADHSSTGMSGMSGSSMCGMKGMANMPGMEMCGDRGFSKLENGMQHGHSFTQPISDADRATLAHQMELARQVALQYPTVAAAEAAGLRRAGPFAPGLGAHYLSNFANSLGTPDGVMTDDWVRHPLAWIYDGTKPDSKVAGLFYGTMVQEPAGFAGPNDIWHTHTNICLKNRPDGSVDAPLGADQPVTKKMCDGVGGSLLKTTPKLAHVWVVPGYESPEGVFAHLTSAVTCDDGTYRIMKDLTKVGTRTSVCRDGSE